MLRTTRTPHIRKADTARGQDEKRQMMTRLRAERREGIVFKHLSAPSTPGRPASGGSQLKYKFVSTATVYVAAVNEHRRSVRMSVSSTGLDGVLTDVGSVTIPPNAEIPPIGALIEVQYLYAYPGGSLYQPVYRGIRDDLNLSACRMTQLKFKTAPEETGDDDAGNDA